MENKAKKIFCEYLEAKSSYHKKRAEFFKLEALKLNKTPEEKEILKELALKEKAHEICLKEYNSNPDIIKAEAIKIQLASFAFKQTALSSEKINPKQIKEYIKKANDYFIKTVSKQTEPYLKIYFQDCLDLMKNWMEIINSIEYQENHPNIIYGINKTERLDLAGKTTNKIFKTLDEKLVKN